MIRHRFSVVATFAMLLGLTSCATRTAAPMQPELGIYSAGAGGAFLPYAQGLAAYLASRGIKATALESSGSIENIQRVNADSSKLGTVFLGTAYEGVTGTGAWSKGVKYSNVRALFPMYETSFQVVALRNTGISSLSQLEGKRVGVGPAGGPAESFFKGLGEAIRLQTVVVTGTPAALASDLLEGRIDALWQGAALPIPPVKQIADATDAVVFGLNESELAAMLARFPFLAPTTVAPHMYRGQSAPIRSVAAWNFIVSNKDLPDATAYALTKEVLNAADPKQAIHSTAAPTRAANAPMNSVVPFHPGALKYYREAGIRDVR